VKRSWSSSSLMLTPPPRTRSPSPPSHTTVVQEEVEGHRTFKTEVLEADRTITEVILLPFLSRVSICHFNPCLVGYFNFDERKDKQEGVETVSLYTEEALMLQVGPKKGEVFAFVDNRWLLFDA
jgi:hypothetical protein